MSRKNAVTSHDSGPKLQLWHPSAHFPSVSPSNPQSILFRLPRRVCWVQSVVGLAVEDAQNGEEQVDDVEVQANGGGNLLFHVVLAHDELRVDEDVSAEDEGSQAAVDELAGRAVGEEHGHESEQDEAPQRAEEVGHPRGEVVLGLAGEQGEEDEEAGGQYHGVEHDGRLVEGDDDGNRISLSEGKERQEEQVCRVRLALPVRQAQEDQGADELLLVRELTALSRGEPGKRTEIQTTPGWL